MSKSTSPSRPKPLGCKAEQPAERPPNVQYTEESHPLKLSEAAEYFSLRITVVFRVSEGAYSPGGRKGVAEGDIIIVCLKNSVSFLKLRPAVPSPGKDPVTIPVKTQTEFALIPRNQEGNETDAAIRNWEGVFRSVSEFLRKGHSIPMPAALKVLDNTLDHNRQKVPADTILFNIRQVNQRVNLRKRHGIEGVDYSGTVHCFLENEDPLYFSTKLFDVKCTPPYFTSVLQFPQTARVYLHPDTEGEERNSLQSLSIVTIHEVIQGYYLIVRKLSDCGNELGPTFPIPWNADLKVVAIKLKDSHLSDNISGQRRVLVRSKSCPTTSARVPPNVTTYLGDPKEVTRDDLQAGMKKGCDKEAYCNADTSKLQNNSLSDAVAFPRHPASTDSTAAGVCYHNHTNATMCDAEASGKSNIHKDVEDVAPVILRGKKQPLNPRRPTRPLSAPAKHWDYQKDNGAASLGNSPVTPTQTDRKRQSHHLPCSGWQEHNSRQGRSIDAHPTEQQLLHHVAQKLGADWKSFAIYLGFEHTHVQQADREQVFEHKAFDILVAWLKGKGSKPNTWATILTALETAGRGDLACDIRRHIERGTLFASISQV